VLPTPEHWFGFTGSRVAVSLTHPSEGLAAALRATGLEGLLAQPASNNATHAPTSTLFSMTITSVKS